MQISHLSKPTSTMSESEKRTRTSQSKDRASASSSSKTPRREFFTHNGSKRSPVSPTRITRLQEKEEMQSLNDRLIIYIDTVRALQDENRQLRTDMSHFNEGSTREVTEIKVLYERELEDAKRLIDELAKEKAKFEIEVNKYKASYQEANEKLNRALKESKVAFFLWNNLFRLKISPVLFCYLYNGKNFMRMWNTFFKCTNTYFKRVYTFFKRENTFLSA